MAIIGKTHAAPPVIGRPTKYSAQVMAEICDIIRDGGTLRESAERLNISSKVIYDWLRKHSEFRDEYDRAREDRGAYYGRRVAEIGEMVEKGEIPPAAGKVAIDAFKWTAARMHPSQYGDRVQVESSVNMSAQAHDAALDQQYADLLDRIGQAGQRALEASASQLGATPASDGGSDQDAGEPGE